MIFNKNIKYLSKSYLNIFNIINKHDDNEIKVYLNLHKVSI